MEQKLPKPDFLTFAELAGRWGYSDEYIHDLLRTGKIIPEIALSDAERYVGGEFSGGYLVGDIENATHKCYSEYYVGTGIDQDNHPENWPQCNRLVYCHCPVDDGNSGYSFQFVSESPYPGETKRWFYLDQGMHIGSTDWKRFRFVWSEIERRETENTVDGESNKALQTIVSTPKPQLSSLAPAQRTKPHKLESRVHVLDAEIKMARSNALDPNDTNCVWTELLKLAETKMGCLLEVVDGELKYDATGEVKIYNKKSLREKIRREKAR